MQSQRVQELLDGAARAFVFSGYQLFAGRGEDRLELYGGVTSYWSPSNAVTAETYFDIGSITKVVVTTSLCALGVDRGELRVDDPLGRFLPSLDGTPLAGRTLGDCLSHSSGLCAWLPVHKETDDSGLVAWFAREASRVLTRSAGERAEYSDLGFLLLGKALESVYGDLGVALEQHVLAPLGLESVAYGPVPTQQAAATEYCTLRAKLVQGEVFDENAALLGTRLGHAGVFATARALAPWCQEWLKALSGESQWLSQTTARLFTRPSHRVAGSTWAYGWDTRSAAFSSAGQLFSQGSFGHLGYPGCSVWIDPQMRGYCLMFTNRIHPSRFDERIRGLRPQIYDAVYQYWMERG